VARAIGFCEHYALMPVFEGAKCKDIDNPDWFFDDVLKNRYGVEYAPEQVKFCSDCPVKLKCLDYALRVDVRGVWGGTTHYERKKMRRQLGIVAEQVGVTNSRLERIRDEVA